jgi:hypothetical protein
MDGVNPDQIVDVTVDPFYTFSTPVTSFSITGIDPEVDGGDPNAFPTFLQFDTTGTFTMTPIPEPSSWLLAALAGLGLLGVRRSRQA